MQELERQINQDQSGFNGLKKARKCVSCQWWKERENWLVVVSYRVTFRGKILVSVTDSV